MEQIMIQYDLQY